MARRKIWIAIIVILVLNAMMILLRTGNSSRAIALTEVSRADETKELSRGFRMAPLAAANEPYFLIGGLAKFGYWTKILPLNEQQKKAIVSLDELVRKARNESLSADADYLDKNPADYLEYVKRNNARRSETIGNAERMVATGFLTEPQADLLIQHYLSTKRKSYTSRNVNVQKLIGMTEKQKSQLADVWDAANLRQGRLNLMSVDPQVQKENAAEMVANDKATDLAVTRVFTPSQREKWSRLSTKRVLATRPPDFSEAPDPGAERFDLKTLSPVFRAFSDQSNKLELSEDQRKLLKDLEDRTRLGLSWIDTSATHESSVSKTPLKEETERRREFLSSAEQIALNGILTERQAELIKSSIE